jgi:Zn ribbon nucleic-acid-binding protein
LVFDLPMVAATEDDLVDVRECVASSARQRTITLEHNEEVRLNRQKLRAA